MRGLIDGDELPRWPLGCQHGRFTTTPPGLTQRTAPHFPVPIFLSPFSCPHLLVPIFLSPSSCLQLLVSNFLSPTSCLQLLVSIFLSPSSCPFSSCQPFRQSSAHVVPLNRFGEVAAAALGHWLRCWLPRRDRLTADNRLNTTVHALASGRLNVL